MGDADRKERGTYGAHRQYALHLVSFFTTLLISRSFFGLLSENGTSRRGSFSHCLFAHFCLSSITSSFSVDESTFSANHCGEFQHRNRRELVRFFLSCGVKRLFRTACHRGSFCSHLFLIKDTFFFIPFCNSQHFRRVTVVLRHLRKNSFRLTQKTQHQLQKSFKFVPFRCPLILFFNLTLPFFPY